MQNSRARKHLCTTKENGVDLRDYDELDGADRTVVRSWTMHNFANPTFVNLAAAAHVLQNALRSWSTDL